MSNFFQKNEKKMIQKKIEIILKCIYIFNYKF